MHAGGAAMSRGKGRGATGAHGLVLSWIGDQGILSRRLQQRASRRASLCVRWKRLQLDMSDETDHVWAGRRK